MFFSIEIKTSSSLTIGHLIGKGAFGFVYQGLAKGINSDEKLTTVAIKTVRSKLIIIEKNNIQSNIFSSSKSDDATSDEIENLLKELSVMKMVGKHINIISLLGCCTKGGKISCLHSSFEKKTNLFIGEVMLIVEYAKYGNLRDYLRRKRPPGHVLSGSFEQDENDDSYKQDDNDDLIHSLTTIDLILFCLQIASGMEYLHSKKVRKKN
jgi:serine/threonine protein kinase